MGKVEAWFTHAWYGDPYTRGAFAQFGPGQFGTTDKGGFSLFASLQAPAALGRLHFAGEATSIHHAWVLGALNSAWRAVHNAVVGDFNPVDVPKDLKPAVTGALGIDIQATPKETLVEMLKRIWGIPDEYDISVLVRAVALGNFGVGV